MGVPSTVDVCRHENRVFLIVEGDFLDDVAITAAQQFEECVGIDDTPLEFVALVKRMGTYGTPGRKAWQEALARAKPRLHRVTIQCDSALVRMAASAICLYAGLKLRFIDDPHEFAHMLPDARATRAS